MKRDLDVENVHATYIVSTILGYAILGYLCGMWPPPEVSFWRAGAFILGTFLVFFSGYLLNVYSVLRERKQGPAPKDVP